MKMWIHVHNMNAWVIEFQCKEKTFDNVTFVNFVGINFYCAYSHPSQKMINDMLDVAYQQGLGFYLNRTMRVMPQDDCLYPWNYTRITQ